jgi:CRISPR-associated protein Cmr2
MSNPAISSESAEETIYTAITFAPVQGFIENSRKLRDLYGSSYILSYLANSICDSARKQNLHVISPALTNITQGTPNQICIHGNFSQQAAQETFNQSWKQILQTCQTWIEATVIDRWQWNEATQVYDQTSTPWNYCWGREWKLCAAHSWEFFWAQGFTSHQAKVNLFKKKRSRNWTGINWTGESSSLSGADGLVLPSAGTYHPQQSSPREQEAESNTFFAQLSFAIGKAFIDNIREQLKADRDRAIARYGRGFIRFVEGTFQQSHNKAKQKELYQTYGSAILDPTEQLSIPELAKRLITLEAIAQQLNIPLQEIPETYRDLNRLPQKQKDPTQKRWTGWFLGDGDQVSEYIKGLSDAEITNFSQEMLDWGEQTLKPNLNDNLGRIIYAGGDDFLGVFYRKADDQTEADEFINPVLQPYECLNWFYRFRSGHPTDDLWTQKDITVSVGFVWAAPNVPQRDVLQHCRETEKVAKDSGRDRIAIRILFNGGQHLEWTCPWRFLPILKEYRDRSGGQNWTHIFNDIAVLESRHAFSKDQSNIATALFKIYFGQDNNTLDSENWWNCTKKLGNGKERPVGGILGERDRIENQMTIHATINNWVINLAKVGFHLCSNI